MPPPTPTPAPTLNKYWFTLILADVDMITPAMAEALFEAGCDDATPGSSGGVVMVEFSRAAVDFGDAVGSAIRDVERAGYKVARMEVEEEPPPLPPALEPVTAHVRE